MIAVILAFASIVNWLVFLWVVERVGRLLNG